MAAPSCPWPQQPGHIPLPTPSQGKRGPEPEPTDLLGPQRLDTCPTDVLFSLPWQAGVALAKGSVPLSFPSRNADHVQERVNRAGAMAQKLTDRPGPAAPPPGSWLQPRGHAFPSLLPREPSAPGFLSFLFPQGGTELFGRQSHALTNQNGVRSQRLDYTGRPTRTGGFRVNPGRVFPVGVCPQSSLLYRNAIGLCLAPANSQRFCGFQQVP